MRYEQIEQLLLTIEDNIKLFYALEDEELQILEEFLQLRRKFLNCEELSTDEVKKLLEIQNKVGGFLW